MSEEDWVFIPGTLCDGRVFGALLDRLGDTLSGTVRVVDVLDDDNLSALAQRATQGLGPQLRIVGFSLGCQVAFEIMRQDPTRCTGCTLINSTARPDEPGLAINRRAMVDRFRRDGADTLVEAELWPRYVADPMRSGHPARELVLSMARDTSDAHFAAQIELVIRRPDSRPDLARFSGPVLMINGREDRLTPIELGAEIVECARNGFHEIIDGAAHFVLLEKPDPVSQAIKEWVSGTRSLDVYHDGH